MQRFLQFFFLSLLFPFSSIAQTAFQPGLVVNLKGDTVRGFINYREWEKNPGSIAFKTDSLAQPVKLSPRDTKYFNVFVGHLAEYVRYSGPVSANNINTSNNQITIGADSSFMQDTVFLKVLQHGKNIVLFSYSDNQKVHFFIAQDLNAPPSELIYRIYYNSEEHTQGRTVDDYTYKGQLYDAAVKAGAMSPALKNTIKNCDYQQEDIVDVAGVINGISSNDLTKNNPSKHHAIDKTFAIVAGAVILIVMVVEFGAKHSPSH